MNNDDELKDIMTEQFLILTNQLTEYNKKFDSLLSINNDLISQNLKMSDLLYGKVPEAPDIQTNEKKELFYYVQDEIVHVNGPGTYDNKDELRKNGSWNGPKKCWIMKFNEEQLKETFPDITIKD